MKLLFNKKQVLLGILFVVVAAIIIAVLMPRHDGSGSGLDTAQNQPINIKVINAKAINVPEYAQSIGGLFAVKKITISPQIPGQIKSINFKNGQRVVAGQLLYQLDTSIIKAKLNAANAQLHLSQITYAREKKLASEAAIALEGLDKATANLKVDQAILSENKKRLDKMQIRAPFAGVISATKVDAGQYVQVGESLATLVDKQQLIVRFSVPERYLSQLSVGQKVVVTSSAFPEAHFMGTVNYVSPTVEASTRTIMVWAKLPNPNLKLAPGLFVHVRLTLGNKHDVILIPQEALIPTVEGNTIFIVRQGKAYQQSVTIGQTIGDEIEILKGVKAGDTVVTLGQEKLSNGRAVKVVSK